MTTVGYIGLGQMGAAMAGWLADSDVSLVVHDVTDAAVAPFAERGAVVASSAAEVAAQCNVLSICVPAAHHVEAVLTGPGGVREAGASGQTILVHSTISAASMQSARATAAEWGADLHDACIYGGIVNAAKGELVVFAGGLGDIDAAGREVLDRYGSLVLDCGPVGAGAALKIAANVMTYSQFMATSVTYAIARRAGADAERVIDAWRSVGQLGVLTERFLPVAGMAPGTMPASFRSFMQATNDIAVKDLELAVELLDDAPDLQAAITALTSSMAAVYGVADTNGGSDG